MRLHSTQGVFNSSLFSIYINNIHLAAGNSLIHLYADDTTILYACDPSPSVQSTHQDSFLQVQHALSQLKLPFNKSRTKVMGFYRKGVPSPSPLNISTCEGARLEQVSIYKYLGIWLDTTLCFSHHISRLQSKVRAKLGFLHRLHFNLSKGLFSQHLISVI